MALLYKAIHPEQYFNDYLSQKIRPDGRQFDELRDFQVNLKAITTADASVIIKCGNTMVLCGVKLELAKPKAEEPDKGFIVTNVELPALCSSKLRPGPPSDYAQTINNLISDIFRNSSCINLKDLCIVPDKLAWVLYCDMLCMDYDGSVVDSCLSSLLSCLKILKLPSVQFDVETEEITVDTDTQTPLLVHGLPVATSFAVYNSDVLLTDPTTFEEEMCGELGTNFVLCWNKDIFCGLQKFGGSCNLSNEFQEKAMKISKERARLVEELINTNIKNLK